MNFIITLLIFVVMLGLIVFLHEFGHFIAAKKAGVYIDEFSIGMGPVIWKKKPKESETTYSLRLFPIGGFVSMAQEENKDLKIDKNRVLSNKSFIARLLVMLMGIIFNCLSAILIFFISGLIYGYPVNEPYISIVAENSPAYEVGIEAGDKILKINSVTIKSWEDVLLELSAKKLKDNYEIIVQKENGETVEYNLSPVIVETEDGETRSFGIGSGEARKEKGFVAAIKYGFYGFTDNVKTIFRILGSLFTGEVKLNSLSGPVGIYGIIDSVKSQGLEMILYLIAYLSINVAVINLLPLPVFDGGRILLMLVEKITKKKINEKIEYYINFIGFGLMILLMVFVTINDIIRLF